ncbi:MAG: ATP-binding protein [Acidobacteria bacterium]|nr:ATP-binding protein [Acidobacteriota bacterium]
MNNLIARPQLEQAVLKNLDLFPITAIIGPRQSGKTTLARTLSEFQAAEYFDLEDPRSRERLQNPMTVLERLNGLVIIDEVQLQPELFQLLRVLADRRPLKARFLILGSASPDLIRASSESLAGRIGYIDIGGFDLGEVGCGQMHRLWLRGGFPPSFLASDDEASQLWRENFIRTFLERDLRLYGIETAPSALRRFWNMLAHCHGQLWNGSDIGRSLNASHTTMRRHLDILTGAFMIRQLQPYHENLSKRQVKSPKIYIRDSGLFHTLMRIDSMAALEAHPKLGASWEGFALEQVLQRIGERDVYFWATQSGAELDLLYFRAGRRFGVEFKHADAPAINRSMRIAIADLRIEHLYVVYPGPKSYQLGNGIKVLAMQDLNELKNS